MLYSIVVPIYNDGYLAEDFVTNTAAVFKKYLNTTDIDGYLELIFINDGSKNDSLASLNALLQTYNFVKIINLSRNFGQHIALSAGYEHAKGDYVVMLNVDQQEPPSEIPKLLDFIKANDYDIVFGTALRRETSFVNRITSNMFNIILNYLTQSKTPLNVTTLRVMNRKYTDAYNQLSEKSRYLPGLENWLGFSHGYINIKHNERKRGKSSYNFKKRLLLAAESIISFSDFPLRIISSIGFIIACVGFLLSLYLLVTKLFYIDYVPGYTSTISIITFLGGIQIMALGLVSLYVGRILKEVQNRPLYIIKDKYNF